MNRRSRAIALSIFWPLIALTGACGDDSPSPGQTGDGGGTTPAPQVSRLAWSQAAPSLAAVQGYSFILFIDGARTPFQGTTCSGAPASAGFECSGPLPALSPGRRVLEIAAARPGASSESQRSAPLTVDVGSDGRPRASLTEEAGSGSSDDVATLVPPPSTACAVGPPSDCFTVSVIATDIAPVRRLLPLSDGRLLVLQENGGVTILPSGTSEPPEFAARADRSAVNVADVAVDPDFHVNRFLYFAITARAPEGWRTVRVVRVRELADRMGESATIVADLPVAPAGDPVISIGPDGHIYLAMPGPADDRLGYFGHVLRFTHDGRAAGNARNGSPILAQGRVQPTRLAWDAASRLLMTSAESGAVLVVAAVSGDVGGSGLPVASLSVGTGATSPNTRLIDMAAAPPTLATGATLAIIEGDPGALVLVTLTLANAPQIGSRSAIALPSLTPTAVAFAGNGDLFVAASQGTKSGVILLRLRRISSRPAQ